MTVNGITILSSFAALFVSLAIAGLTGWLKSRDGKLGRSDSIGSYASLILQTIITNLIVLELITYLVLSQHENSWDRVDSVRYSWFMHLMNGVFALSCGVGMALAKRSASRGH